jgi:hypothetical protein
MDSEAFENTRKNIEERRKENQIREDQEQGWTTSLL